MKVLNISKRVSPSPIPSKRLLGADSTVEYVKGVSLKTMLKASVTVKLSSIRWYIRLVFNQSIYLCYGSVR